VIISISSSCVTPFSIARGKVKAHLLGLAGRDQRRAGDEAAIALRELRALPDVAEQHVVGQLGELGRELTDGGLGDLGHRALSFRSGLGDAGGDTTYIHLPGHRCRKRCAQRSVALRRFVDMTRFRVGRAGWLTEFLRR
jgi:hypothetical protein